MSIDELKKKPDENDSQYIWRIGQMHDNKQLDMTWVQIGELFNSELVEDETNYLTESAYRKRYRIAVQYYDDVFKHMLNNKEYVDDIDLKKYELQKERQKLSDVTTHINKQIREISRFENLKEIAIEMAKIFNDNIPFLDFKYERLYDTKKSGILIISDWHFGIEIDNFINKYNIDVFKNRINQLIKKTIDKIKLYQIEKLYVINLNDLISGIIHSTIRLQNREDLMTQIITVSETLSELLVELSKYAEIEYYSTLDNHSRAIADKKQSLDCENFSLLIDWFLKERLKNTDIKINKNEFDDETCTFEIYGWNYLAVHGHKDKITNVIQNLSLMTKRFYNSAFTAHYHHVSSDEIHGNYVFANGCLSGVDVHSNDLRKTSNPSQNLFIVSEDDYLEDVCIIKLK